MGSKPQFGAETSSQCGDLARNYTEVRITVTECPPCAGVCRRHGEGLRPNQPVEFSNLALGLGPATAPHWTLAHELPGTPEPNRRCRSPVQAPIRTWLGDGSGRKEPAFCGCSQVPTTGPDPTAGLGRNTPMENAPGSAEVLTDRHRWNERRQFPLALRRQNSCLRVNLARSTVDIRVLDTHPRSA